MDGNAPREGDDLARRLGRRVRALRKARKLGETEIEARLFNFKYLQRIGVAGETALKSRRATEKPARARNADAR